MDYRLLLFLPGNMLNFLYTHRRLRLQLVIALLSVSKGFNIRSSLLNVDVKAICHLFQHLSDECCRIDVGEEFLRASKRVRMGLTVN